MSAAALIPAAKVGAGLFGSWLGSKIEKNATQPTQMTATDYARSPEEQKTYAGITQGADDVRQQGQQLSQTAQPLNQGAANYYGALVRGNKSAVNAATATERGGISETYRGAEAANSRLRGPARDKAKAELTRQKTSQLAALPLAARQYGAQGAAQLGTSLSGQASQNASTSSSAYGAAAANDTARQANRLNDTRAGDQLKLAANQQNQAAGSKWGDLFSKILGGLGSGGGSSSGSPTSGTLPGTWNGGRGGYGTGEFGEVNGIPISGYQPGVSQNKP